MSLRHVQRTYEKFAKDDPLYAVLSDTDKRGQGWDPEAFFATGKDEITEALGLLRKLDADPARGAALDFGCGVGRLTQALADRFERVVGIDISISMVEHAREFNRHGARCEYLVNTTDDLTILTDASFDFVYSNIALQHSPPAASSRYIAEFFRLLRPQGVALFHIPSGPRHDPGSLGALIYSLRSGVLRRMGKRIRGLPTVEMHYINRSVVEEIIHASGGRVVDVAQSGSVRRKRVGVRYCARRR